MVIQTDFGVCELRFVQKWESELSITDNFGNSESAVKWGLDNVDERISAHRRRCTSSGRVEVVSNVSNLTTDRKLDHRSLCGRRKTRSAFTFDYVEGIFQFVLIILCKRQIVTKVGRITHIEDIRVISDQKQCRVLGRDLHTRNSALLELRISSSSCSQFVNEISRREDFFNEERTIELSSSESLNKEDIIVGEVVRRQCRTVNQVSSVVSSSNDVLIQVYSQSDLLNGRKTIDFGNLVVRVLFDTSSDAITQGNNVTNDEVRSRVSIEDSYTIVGNTERTIASIVRKWIICTSVLPCHGIICGSACGMCRSDSTRHTSNCTGILVSTEVYGVIYIIRTSFCPRIGISRCRPRIVCQIDFDSRCSTDILPNHSTISYCTDFVGRSSRTRSCIVSSIVKFAIRPNLVVYDICFARFPDILGTINIKRDFIDSVLFTLVILVQIVIIECTIDLTDLIGSSKTRIVNSTSRDFYNGAVCLYNAIAVDLLQNTAFLELNRLIEDEFLNSVDLLITSVSNIVFGKNQGFDFQFSAQRGRNRRSLGLIGISVLCKGICARSKSRYNIRVVKNLQTRRTNVPGCNYRIRDGIGRIVDTFCLEVQRFSISSTSRYIVTSLGVETVKLDQFQSIIGCRNSITLSRNNQRRTTVYCSRINDNIVNMTQEGVANQRTALRSTNSQIIHYDVVCSRLCSDLNTIKVTRVDIRTKRRFFLHQSDVVPTLVLHSGPIGGTNRPNSSCTTTNRVCLQTDLTEVTAARITINNVLNISTSVIDDCNHVDSGIISGMGVIHANPEHRGPFFKQIDVLPDQTVGILEFERSGAELRLCIARSDVSSVENGNCAYQVLLSVVISRICLIFKSMNDCLDRILSVSRQNDVTRVIHCMGVNFETNIVSRLGNIGNLGRFDGSVVLESENSRL